MTYFALIVIRQIFPRAAVVIPKQRSHRQPDAHRQSLRKQTHALTGLPGQNRRTPQIADTMTTKRARLKFTGSGTAVMPKLQPFKVAWPPPATSSAKNSVHDPSAFGTRNAGSWRVGLGAGFYVFA
jgi:hypothetical protein